MGEFDYSTIRVSGADAFDFLQAQLAADLTRLRGQLKPSAGIVDENHQSDLSDTMLSAWCNPKGRVICLFRVARDGDDYLLSLPTELADAVVRRMTMFRFRAKVDLAVERATPAKLGIDGSLEDWRVDNLRKGIPEISTAQSEEFTPHMLNLDLLGAASIDKGCYPGQEIVARTHYRGKTKRRMLRFESEEPVSAGDKVLEGDRAVGDVVNAIDNDLLAVVPLEKAGVPLTVDGISLRNVKLQYL